jgi:hypothetical protein
VKEAELPKSALVIDRADVEALARVVWPETTSDDAVSAPRIELVA